VPVFRFKHKTFEQNFSSLPHGDPNGNSSKKFLNFYSLVLYETESQCLNRIIKTYVLTRSLAKFVSKSFKQVTKLVSLTKFVGGNLFNILKPELAISVWTLVFVHRQCHCRMLLIYFSHINFFTLYTSI
jgi:hypothetical protein